MVYLAVFNFDDERVGELGVLGGDHKVVCLTYQDFYMVVAVSKVVNSLIKSLLLDNLILIDLLLLHLT